jgi:hypothetical protein
MTLESIAVTETALVFDYTVSNYSPFPVHLLNNLARPSGSGELAVKTNLVYAWFENSTSLSLAKQLLALPDQVALDSAMVPFVSTLEARWTMSETLRLSLPVELYHPYDVKNRGNQGATMTHFTFTLGYILADRPVHFEEVLLEDGNNYARPLYQEALERQRLNRSRPVQASITFSN